MGQPGSEAGHGIASTAEDWLAANTYARHMYVYVCALLVCTVLTVCNPPSSPA